MSKYQKMAELDPGDRLWQLAMVYMARSPSSTLRDAVGKAATELAAFMASGHVVVEDDGWTIETFAATAQRARDDGGGKEKTHGWFLKVSPSEK